MAVTAADGSVWEVRRRWMPWHPRWRRFDQDPVPNFVPDVLLGADDILGGAAYIVVGIVFAITFAFVLVPLTVLFLEILLLLALLAGGVALRIVFRRPWLIDVSGPQERTYAVVGWRRSARAGDLIADHLRSTGRLLSDDDLARRLG